MPDPDAKGAERERPSRRKRRWRPFRIVTQRPRLAVAAVVAVLVGGLLAGTGVKPMNAILFGFNAGALVFLVGVALMFVTATPANMRDQAMAQDTGRRSTLASAVAVSAVVLVALANELHAAKGGGAPAIVMAAVSIVLSWLFMNTMYALHYAHGYYGDFGEQHKGLDFPGDGEPDYWDFAYFAFVIGMCFQVSDVQITSGTLRRTVLQHSVVAFFFNVFIIAISVNIAAGAA